MFVCFVLFLSLFVWGFCFGLGCFLVVFCCCCCCFVVVVIVFVVWGLFFVFCCCFFGLFFVCLGVVGVFGGFFLGGGGPKRDGWHVSCFLVSQYPNNKQSVPQRRICSKSFTCSHTETGILLRQPATIY